MKSESQSFWVRNRLLFTAILLLTIAGLGKTFADREFQGRLVMAYKNVDGVVKLLNPY
jgi:hypothetical protein